MVCVTFKFVCFDGIEGKNHADEELRKKKKRGRRRALWDVLELGEVIWKKKGKKEIKEKSGYVCELEKKRDKKRKKRRKCSK